MEPGCRAARLVALACLGLVSSWLRTDRVSGSDAARSAVRDTIASEGPATPREEFFVLEEPIEPGQAPALEGGPSLELRAVGLAIARRLQVDAGHQLEWDILFPDQGTRVLHIERWSEAGTRLIWRELRPGSGRSLSAEWLDEGDGLRLREWAGDLSFADRGPRRKLKTSRK